MPTFMIPKESFYVEQDGNLSVPAIRKEAFDRFNPSVLGLGDISSNSVGRPAIAALFDLGGFTGFCKQIEPHLSVPIYLSGFLNWIFSVIRMEVVRKEYSSGVRLWHDLPFFTKFMGDGLLVLFDTTAMNPVAQHNLVMSCRNICARYEQEFLPGMRRKVTDAPPVLRCGIAKGTVFSVGNGEDYVGSCINVSARLQKLAGLKVVFARRGFDPEEVWKKEKFLGAWLLKRVSVRGIGENELIYVRKDEFERLRGEEKRLFSDP